MNDFTKGELEMILESLIYVHEKSVTAEIRKQTYCLSKKVESMIDNYCEPPKIDWSKASIRDCRNDNQQ